MDDFKEQIAYRLKVWLEGNFLSINEGIKALGKDPSSFRSSYLNAKSAPGAALLIKLSELGCDITWLLTGTNSEESKILDQAIKRDIELQKEKEDLTKENQNLRQQLARKLVTYGMVAEPKKEYK